MPDTTPPATPDAPPRFSMRSQTQALWLLSLAGWVLIAAVIYIRVCVAGAAQAETFLATITQAILSIETGIAGFYFGSSYNSQQGTKP